MSEKPTIQFEIYDGDRLLRTEVLAESTIKIGKLSSSHVRIDDDAATVALPTALGYTPDLCPTSL